jgi:DNA-binding transcriptional LysR family regulator
LLAAFRRRYPQVEIRLRQSGSAALAAEVAAGRLDVAFAYRSEADAEHLRSISLTSEPMIVLCHPDHSLAKAGTAPVLRNLDGEVFVDFHPDWGPRRVTDAAFAALGMQRTVALEVNDVHSLLDLVYEGLGIAVAPRHFECKRPGLTALPLQDTGGAVYETAALLLPAPQATSPAAQALMALLEARLTEAAPVR